MLRISLILTVTALRSALKATRMVPLLASILSVCRRERKRSTEFKRRRTEETSPSVSAIFGKGTPRRNCSAQNATERLPVERVPWPRAELRSRACIALLCPGTAAGPGPSSPPQGSHRVRICKFCAQQLLFLLLCVVCSRTRPTLPPVRSHPCVLANPRKNAGCVQQTRCVLTPPGSCAGPRIRVLNSISIFDSPVAWVWASSLGSGGRKPPGT